MRSVVGERTRRVREPTADDCPAIPSLAILSPMRIDSALPMHIARAYSLKPAAAPVVKPQTPTTQLVAGRVDKPVDFSASPPTRGAMEAFQLYNRAADRVEAAVGIQVGRQLDVKG